MVLRLDSIDVGDYSGSNPDLKTYNANIDLELTDVSDVKQIIEPLRLKMVALGADFVFETLTSSLTNLNTYLDLGENLIDISDGALDTGKESIQEGVKNIKEKGESLKNVFDSFKKE